MVLVKRVVFRSFWPGNFRPKNYEKFQEISRNFPPPDLRNLENSGISNFLAGGQVLARCTTSTSTLVTTSKGLKHEILSKARNRLSDDQAIILYGMSENLQHLHKATVEMMDKMQDSAGQYFPN